MKKLSFLTLLTVLVSLSLMADENEAEDTKPSIIFIMADDLGYGDLGSYGQHLIQTPHLDQMAREGMKFNHYYAGSTVCAPSRSVLMTGQHSGHTRVRGNFGRTGVVGLSGIPGRVPLKFSDLTVAEVLQQAGYKTGMFGKWGLGEPDTSGEPNAQGFDEFYGFLNQRRAHKYYPEFLFRNRLRVTLEENLYGKRGLYCHDQFTEEAIKFIRNHSQEPFFLYLPYSIPHADYEVPDIAPYVDEDWDEEDKVYAAMVTRLDRDVGQILEVLESLGIDENTVVFFCSDNGAAERRDETFSSSGLLQGRKRDLFEGGIRSPMIVRWPGKIKPDSESDLIWYAADVLPTLASITGEQISSAIDGLDISEQLKGAAPTDAQLNRKLYWEFHETGFQQAVRWRQWKAIRANPGIPLELYDVLSDPGETSNVAASHPDVISEIEAYLLDARIPSYDWPVKVTPDPVN